MESNTGMHEVPRPIEEVIGSLVVKRATYIILIQVAKLTAHVAMLSVNTAQIS